MFCWINCTKFSSQRPSLHYVFWWLLNTHSQPVSTGTTGFIRNSRKYLVYFLTNLFFWTVRKHNFLKRFTAHAVVLKICQNCVWKYLNLFTFLYFKPTCHEPCRPPLNLKLFWNLTKYIIKIILLHYCCDYIAQLNLIFRYIFLSFPSSRM